MEHPPSGQTPPAGAKFESDVPLSEIRIITVFSYMPASFSAAVTLPTPSVRAVGAWVRGCVGAWVREVEGVGVSREV